MPDAFTTFTVVNPNVPPYSGTLGLLSPGGVGLAQVTLPPGQSPSLAGLTAWHAALALGVQTDFVSNPAAIKLTP